MVVVAGRLSVTVSSLTHLTSGGCNLSPGGFCSVLVVAEVLAEVLAGSLYSREQRENTVQSTKVTVHTKKYTVGIYWLTKCTVRKVHIHWV